MLIKIDAEALGKGLLRRLLKFLNQLQYMYHVMHRVAVEAQACKTRITCWHRLFHGTAKLCTYILVGNSIFSWHTTQL